MCPVIPLRTGDAEGKASGNIQQPFHFYLTLRSLRLPAAATVDPIGGGFDQPLEENPR